MADSYGSETNRGRLEERVSSLTSAVLEHMNALVNTNILGDIMCHTSHMNWHKSPFRSATNFLSPQQDSGRNRRAQHPRDNGLYQYNDRRPVWYNVTCMTVDRFLVTYEYITYFLDALFQSLGKISNPTFRPPKKMCWVGTSARCGELARLGGQKTAQRPRP